MALTIRRWLSLAAILCGVAVIVLLREPAPSRRGNEDSALRQRESLAGQHVARAWERLRLAQLLDSLRRTVPAPSAGASSRVIFARNLPPEATRALGVLLAIVAPARPTTPRVPVDLVFLVDTAPGPSAAGRFGFGSAMRADYVLPGDSVRRCVVIARVRVMRTPDGRSARGSYSALLSPGVRSRLLGPCGFYEWFGMPGPTVSAWLGARGWDLALASSWKSAYPAWTPREYWYSSSFLVPWSPNMRLRMATTTAGYSCATGTVRVCDSLVASAPRARPREFREAALWDGSVVSPAWSLDVDRQPWVWNWNSTQLGPRETTLLAEVARALGPDRFASFWATGRPLREAFREATGMGVGEWTADWAQRAYGRPEKGPAIPVVSLLVAVALSAVSLGYALTRAARRQSG